MIYPPQTSLIPITVTLTRFVETNGITAFFDWYPYWYLGVPFKHLTGPVVPLIFVFVHKILPRVSLFDITICSTILSLLIGATGWAMLVSRIQDSRGRAQAWLVFFFLLVFPWRYLSSLALVESSTVIAKGLLPFVLLTYWNLLKTGNSRSKLICLLVTSFLLLISTSIFSILVVGIASTVLAFSLKKGKIRKISKHIKHLLLLLICSILLTTIWYSPNYWLTILINPSVGGAPGFKAILRMIDLLKASLPFFLAVFVVYFSSKVKSKLAVFGLIWTFFFLFLTGFRFIGDPDFWQDWTTWLYELEIGLALVLSRIVVNTRKARNNQLSITNYQLLFRRILLIAGLILLPFLLTYYVYNLLGKPTLISNKIPKGVQSLAKLNEIVTQDEESLLRETAGGVRVFLSGSTVFWAGSTGASFYQVRGGNDRVATHLYWDHAAYQLREGDDPGLTEAWLEALGVSYVLVHTPFSTEVYHDFRNISKWKEVGQIVWEGRGDFVVGKKDSSLAWIVDLEKLNKVKKPKGGTDLASLGSYLSAKKSSLKAELKGNNQVVIHFEDLRQNEAIVLAISYDKNWRVLSGQKIKKDPLGNILIVSEKDMESPLVLHYK